MEEILDVDQGSVSMADSLESLKWDSLANLSFIAEIDTRLDVTIDADALARSTRPADLLALVTSAVGSK